MFIKYRLADGTFADVEVTEEVAEELENSDRTIRNADRRERDHAPYHLEAMDYEGDSLAYRETPEEILLEKERREVYEEALALLTPAQYRRFTMKWWNRLTIREIAEIEEADPSSIAESIAAARKKLEKYFLKHPDKKALISPYSEETYL